MLYFQEWSRWELDHSFDNKYLVERRDGSYHIFTDEITDYNEVWKRHDIYTKEIQYKTVLKKQTRKTIQAHIIKRFKSKINRYN